MESEARLAVASLKTELLAGDGSCSQAPGGWYRRVAEQLQRCVDTGQQTSKTVLDRLVRVLAILVRSRRPPPT